MLPNANRLKWVLSSSSLVALGVFFTGSNWLKLVTIRSRQVIVVTWLTVVLPGSYDWQEETTPLLSLSGGAWLGSDLKEATSVKNITSLCTIFLVGLKLKWT